MKIQELLEGQLRQGHYTPYSKPPTPQDKGLVAIYNFVIPALSRIFNIPESNFKVQSDYNLLYYNPKIILLSAKKGLMRVKLRKKDLDNVDFIAQMMPKALHNELSKHLTDVQVSEAKYIPAVTGAIRDTPDYLELKFSRRYPQEWLTPNE